MENLCKSRSSGSVTCLICDTGFNKKCYDDGDSILSKHLHVIFILKNIFKLPDNKLVLFLQKYPENVEDWVSVCDKCDDLVTECKGIYQELLEVSRRLKTATEVVIRTVKESNINPTSCCFPANYPKKANNVERSYWEVVDVSKEIRQFVCARPYANHADPFILGDLKALRLAATPVSASIQTVVKEEIEENWKEDECESLANEYSEEDLPLEDEKCKVLLKQETREEGDDDSGEAIENLLYSDSNNENKALHNAVLNNEIEGYSDSVRSAGDIIGTDDNVPEGESLRKRNTAQSEGGDDAETVCNENDTDLSDNIDECDSTSEADDILDGNKNSTRSHVECPFCRYHLKLLQGPRAIIKHFEICKKKQKIQPNPRESASCKVFCHKCLEYDCGADDTVTLFNHLVSCDGSSSVGIPIQLRIFQCSLCPEKEKLFTFLKFLLHYIHHKQFMFECTDCGELLKNSDHTQKHWKLHHTATFVCLPNSDLSSCHRKLDPQPLPKVPWWCRECGKGFDEEDLRDSHVESEHPLANTVFDKNFTTICQFCEKKYKCPKELELHQHISHAVEIKKLQKCEICCDFYRYPWDFQSHKTRVHKQNLLKCDLCGKEYGSKLGYDQHIQSHQENLKCSFCDKLYVNKLRLENHIRGVHTKDVAFTCELCGKSLADKDSLSRHRRDVHGIGLTSKLMCPVEECGRICKSAHTLRAHVARHKTTPHFSCTYCGKGFYTKTNLNRHERTLHGRNSEGPKEYLCDECPYKTRFLQHLPGHKKKYHGAGASVERKLRRPRRCGVESQGLDKQTKRI